MRLSHVYGRVCTEIDVQRWAHKPMTSLRKVCIVWPDVIYAVCVCVSRIRLVTCRGLVQFTGYVTAGFYLNKSCRRPQAQLNNPTSSFEKEQLFSRLFPNESRVTLDNVPYRLIYEVITHDAYRIQHGILI